MRQANMFNIKVFQFFLNNILKKVKYVVINF